MRNLILALIISLVPISAISQSKSSDIGKSGTYAYKLRDKLDTSDYSYYYAYRSMSEMVNDMPPRLSSKYRTTSSLFRSGARIDYVWMMNCPTAPDGDSVIASASGAGCWYRTTFPQITTDNVYLVRDGNMIRMKTDALDSMFTAMMGRYPSASITSEEMQHWDAVYAGWMADRGKYVRLDSAYTNPPFIKSLDVAKVTNAATVSYVDAGVNAEHAYADATYQPKGSYRTAPQTLTLNGATLGITDGNTVSIPVTTTLPYSAITNPPTIPTQTSQLTNNSGFITSVPSYTGTAPIQVNGTVISTTSKQTLFFPDVTFTETAVVALGVGTRRITFTGLAGILTTDRVFISAAGLPPVGYVLGDAVCTVNGTVVLSFYGPLLALGGTNTFTCRVTVLR